MTTSHRDMRMKHRKQAILDFIAAYHTEHGYAPTRREIADAVGYNSTGAIHFTIQQMVNEGTLMSDANIARSIRLAPVEAL